MKNDNKQIFSSHHSGKNLTHGVRNLYDKNFIETKASLLRKYLYCTKNLNILDLCCGSGEYSKYLDTKNNSYFGIDFSYNMLDEFKSSEIFIEGMNLVNADSNKIPIINNKIDICFCFSSLYYLNDIDTVLGEINRVLLKNGVAVLEFATKNNINSHVSNYWAVNANWGFPYFISYDDMMNVIKKTGFEVIEERNFQLFPVLRGPWWSIFIANSFLKPLLKLQYKSITIDEYISSYKILKKYAFKHLVVLRKE